MIRRHPADLIKSIDGDMFMVPGHAAPSRYRRTSGVYTHMAWASGGFVLGAICWYMVGFWSFVDRVLEEARPSAVAVVIARPAAPPESTGRTGLNLLSAVQNAVCARKIAEDTSGATDTNPCAPGVAPNQDQPDAIVAGLANVRQ